MIIRLVNPHRVDSGKESGDVEEAGCSDNRGVRLHQVDARPKEIIGRKVRMANSFRLTYGDVFYEFHSYEEEVFNFFELTHHYYTTEVYC